MSKIKVLLILGIFLLGLLGGAIGIGLYRISEHIYMDHTNHHVIVNIIQESQRVQKPQPEPVK